MPKKTIKLKRGKKMKTCEICQKKCKNQHGLAIHIGHMHKKQTEIEELKQEITSLKSMVASLINEIRQNGITPTNLPKVPSNPIFSEKKENNGEGKEARKIAKEYKDRFVEIRENFSCFAKFDEWG
jgi:regulator of replication initiation timing